MYWLDWSENSLRVVKPIGSIYLIETKLELVASTVILKSLLQHHSSKASILQRSAVFPVQLSHPYMTTGKTIALTRWTFVGKVERSEKQNKATLNSK